MITGLAKRHNFHNGSQTGLCFVVGRIQPINAFVAVLGENIKQLSF